MTPNITAIAIGRVFIPDSLAGERPDSDAGVEKHRGGPEDVDVIGHRRSHDLRAVASEIERAVLLERLPDAGHQKIRSAARAARQNNLLRIEDVDEMGDA